MKIMRTTIISFALLVAGSFFASPAEANLRLLDAVSGGCVATKTYEDEAKCFRAGVNGVRSGYRLRPLLSDMCLPTKTYESEAKCYRAGIDALPGRRRLQEQKDFCVRTTRTYQDEVTCMRDMLRRGPQDFNLDGSLELAPNLEPARFELEKPDAALEK